MKRFTVLLAAAVCAFAMHTCAGIAESNIQPLEFEITDIGAMVVSCAETDGTVVIPEEYNGVTVTAIGDFAFYGSNVKELVIPDSVSYIGESAFFRCRSLESVTLPGGLCDLNSGIFCSCSSLTGIYIPASVSHIETGIFDDCTSLENITVDENNTHYRSVDGVLFDSGVTSLIAYPAAKPCSGYTVPDSVTSVAEYAFSYARFDSVTLPDGLTSIGASAFCRAKNLKNITIPAGVTRIEAVTFSGCGALQSVYFAGCAELDPLAF